MDDNAIEDVELQRYIKFSNSFYRQSKNYEILNEYKVDNGCNFDWTPADFDKEGNNWLMNHITTYNDWNTASIIDDGKTDKKNMHSLQIP